MNLKLINVLKENTEVKEQGNVFNQGVKSFAKILKIGDSSMAKIIGRSEKQLQGSVGNASRQYLKSMDGNVNLANKGGNLPAAVKQASKELVFKRLVKESNNGTKELTAEAIEAIITATKRESDNIFKNVLLDAKTTAKGAATGTKGAATGTKGTSVNPTTIKKV